MKGRANIKKRAKQKLRYLKILKRLKEAKKKAPALSRGLINEALETLTPLAQAIRDQQRLQP
jgi:hypothetical protein